MFSKSSYSVCMLSIFLCCNAFALHETLSERISALIVAVPYHEQYVVLQKVYHTLPSTTLEQKNRLEKIMRLYEARYPELKNQAVKTCCQKAFVLKRLIEGALVQERTQIVLDNPESIKHFWDTFELLLEESGQKVEPQNLIFDLLLNVVVVSGEQFAETLFTQEDKAEQKKLTDRITQIGQSYKETQVKMQQKTVSLLKNLNQSFTAQVGALQKSLGYAQSLFGQEVTYIQRLINLSVPPQRFVSTPVQTELFFKASPMTVPGSSFTWYNVFSSSGDWGFDESEGVFVQRGLGMGLQPASSASIKQNLAQPWSSSGGTDTDTADQNQIFTEYFTSASAYQVQAEVTLIQCTYPFFAGIVFNRARWLSGSSDRMKGYRLVGLYGAMVGGKPTVSLYLGQTQMSTLGILYTTTTPLHQIVSGTLPALYTLESADVNALGKDPLTFRCTVLTQESVVSVTLEKKENTGWKNLFATSVNALDPTESKFLFWYHGIGFMAPGCQAAFKILQPKELAARVGGKV